MLPWFTFGYKLKKKKIKLENKKFLKKKKFENFEKNFLSKEMQPKKGGFPFSLSL